MINGVEFDSNSTWGWLGWAEHVRGDTYEREQKEAKKTAGESDKRRMAKPGEGDVVEFTVWDTE